jgi:hypothetical protein
MIKQGIIALTGEPSELDAWTSVFPTVSGTTKVGIKVNGNNYEVGTGNNIIDWTPQVVNAVIKGLKVRGFSEGNIYILEPSGPRKTPYCGLVTSLYPSVKLYGTPYQGAPYLPSTYSSSDSSLLVVHSDTGITSPSKYPDQFLDVDYFIQMPQFKAHGIVGVTFTYKNLLGYLDRITIPRLHNYLMQTNNNALVDLYANTHVINKTKLVIGDGIYGNHFNNWTVPTRWNVFGDDWPKRIFLSTDPVAIDCVMYDFLDWETARTATHENYIVSAANANQGIRDHWNNPTDRTYGLIDFVEFDVQDGPPMPNRTDVDRRIREFKAGNTTEEDVKDMIDSYMDTN